MPRSLFWLSLMMIVLLFAPPLWGQQLGRGERPRVQRDVNEREPRPKKAPPIELKAVVVDEIHPDSHVKLPPDGVTVEKRSMLGSNLDRAMTARVLRGNVPTSAVTALLKPTNRSDRRSLWLTAKPGAEAGADYRVRLVAGGQTISLPLTIEVLPKKIDPRARSTLPTADIGGKKPALGATAGERLQKGTKQGRIEEVPAGALVGDVVRRETAKKAEVDPRGLVEIAETTLQVKRSDALDAWGDYWNDQPAVKNSFRWTTRRNDLDSFRWEVADSPDFEQIVASAVSGNVASQGKYGFFSIDFAPIAGSRPPPLHYFVRVVPAYRESDATGAPLIDADPSNHVRVSVSPPGEVTEFTDPVITGIMPFSSCDPGGGVVLKGFQFGPEPGEIRLNHPGREIKLENLEWSPTLVQGTVPMLTGLMDSQVTIQVLTKNGSESNTDLVCSFRATREEIALYELCDGVHVQIGGAYADADDYHFSTGDRTDQRLTGWHRSSDAQSGTDLVKLTRFLQNGWQYTRLEFARTSSQHVEASLEQPVGFAPGTTPRDISVHWEIGSDSEVGWQMYVYAEGPAGVRLWEDYWYQAQFCQPRGY